MNVNLYLPDDLGREAKASELPLSQLLQEAVRHEIERRADQLQQRERAFVLRHRAALIS